MTYYAVTDDPNELAHFGILGMKWGVRRTDAQLGHPRHSGSRRPRSAAYKKAQSKLGRMMKSGIRKAEAHWKAYNSPKAKEERFMKKAMQQARTGTLKYGKLTDDQVRRVTDRLALERNARQLGSTENPTYARRLKTAVGEGIIRGIGMGTASYIDERFRGRGKTTAEIKADKRMAKYEASRAGRRAAKRKAKNEINEEYYKTAYEEGDRSFGKLGARQRAQYLSEVKSANKKKDYEASIQKTYDEQLARSKALSDNQRNDWRRNGLINGINSGSRKIQPSTVNYTDPNTGRVKAGTALQALNAWNEAHENVNKHGNAYYDSMNTSLARIKAREARDREKAKSDKAFNEAMRNKHKQDAERESARILREQERQKRINDMNADRRINDKKNTSRKRKGKWAGSS